MKLIIYIFLSLASLLSLVFTNQSCKREGNGSYRYYIKFSSEKPPGVQALSETFYSGLGSYVTSLTPTKFLVKLDMLGFQDDTSQCPESSADILQFVDGNYSLNDSIRIADFTANMQREYQPKLYGKTSGDAWFTDPEISFTYFYFMHRYIYNEIALPEQYRGMKLNQFEGKEYNNWVYWNDSVNKGNVLRLEHHPFVYNIFHPLNSKTPVGYIFGNTDSTFIFNSKGLIQPLSKNHIFCGETRVSTVRSNQYTPLKLRRPEPDEILEMRATVSFNTENLVQIYAGADGVAYTADDVFVYAPKFWERIKVTVENQ